jgi:hypothetical protein
LSTQCFCLQGFTGSYCEGREKKTRDFIDKIFCYVAILCSPTSCNGGLCRSTQNNIVCICPPGKFGDRCQVILIFCIVFIYYDEFLV